MYREIPPIYKSLGYTSWIAGDFSDPEFAHVKDWYVEEKMRGTHARISFNTYTEARAIRGKNEMDYLPEPVLSACLGTFSSTKLRELTRLMPQGQYSFHVLALHETHDTPLVLLDVMINDKWSTRDEVQLIATKLGLGCPPFLGHMTTEAAIEYIKSRPQSVYYKGPMAAIVGRAKYKGKEKLMQIGARYFLKRNREEK